MSGVGFSTALSAGIAFQALETAVSVLGGSAAVAYLAKPPVPALVAARRGRGGCLASPPPSAPPCSSRFGSY